MKPTVEYLIELNPLLEEKDRQELQDLINAFFECDYEWNEVENYFFSTKFGKIVRVKSLHVFTPESIRDWWGNPEYLSERSSMALLSKVGFASIIAVPLCLAVAIFYDWRMGLGGMGIALIVFFLVHLVQKSVLTKRDKREGRWVDSTKIQWCKNCVHFLKVRKWENSFDGLWTSSEMPEHSKLPCRINEETMNTWIGFFDLPPEKRYLYPKDCKRLIIKS